MSPVSLRCQEDLFEEDREAAEPGAYRRPGGPPRARLRRLSKDQKSFVHRLKHRPRTSGRVTDTRPPSIGESDEETSQAQGRPDTAHRTPIPISDLRLFMD